MHINFEELAAHVGCTLSLQEEDDTIVLECVDCEEVLFEIDLDELEDLIQQDP